MSVGDDRTRLWMMSVSVSSDLPQQGVGTWAAGAGERGCPETSNVELLPAIPGCQRDGLGMRSNRSPGGREPLGSTDIAR
jgi:hypothetical protein